MMASSAANSLRPVVFCGPSGSGKSTIMKIIMEKYKNCFAFSVSHTTRSPRKGETHGREYNFVTRPEMEAAIAAGEFLEHAEFSGNIYGTSKKAVQDVTATGKICILDIDLQGVLNVKKVPELNCRYLFIKPPSFAVLEQRLRGRATENEESLCKRLERAKEELAFSEQKGFFDLIVVNDNLEKAVSEIEGFLYEDIYKVKNSQFGAFDKGDH